MQFGAVSQCARLGQSGNRRCRAALAATSSSSYDWRGRRDSELIEFGKRPKLRDGDNEVVLALIGADLDQGDVQALVAQPQNSGGY